MKKTFLITVLLLIVCITLVGCGKKGQEDVKEENQNLVTEVNDFTISLNANPTTGYTWSHTVENSELVEIKSEYVPNKVEDGVVGAGGNEVITIKGLKPGTTTVTFKYSRSWEPSESDKVAEYVITVDDNLNVTETHSGSYFE